MIRAVVIRCALLLQATGGTPVKYTDTEFLLPAGYEFVEAGQGNERHFRRVIKEPAAAEVAMGIRSVPAALDQRALPVPGDIHRLLGLPPGAQLVAHPEPWRKFQVPAAEYRIERLGVRYFGMCVLLPIEGRTFVLDVFAPEALEGAARHDLLQAAASATGSTPWRNRSVPERIPKMLLIVGCPVLMAGWLWGVGTLLSIGERSIGCWSLLFPPLTVVFGIIHFEKSKAPCLVHLLGYVMVFLAVVLGEYAK